ncbi:hypothetical protein BOX15_Mlig005548g1, partial [Macrostomum lignano]
LSKLQTGTVNSHVARDGWCSVSASAPGKVILHGEHAVVYGALAVAGAISQRCRITARWRPADSLDSGSYSRSHAGPIVLNFPALAMRACLDSAELETAFPVAKASIGKPAEAAGDEPPFSDAELANIGAMAKRVADAQQFEEQRQRELCRLALAAFIAVYAWLKPPLLGNVAFLVTGKLPIGGGLGSSAAYAAALAAICEALAGREQLDLSRLEAAAFAAETLVHGRPSGVDNACSVRGGFIAYRRPGPPTPLLPEADSLLRASGVSLPTVYVADTGQARSTASLVAGVRQLADSANLGASIRRIIDAIDSVSESARRLLVAMATGTASSTDEADYLALVRLNQRLLDCLGVSHPLLDGICQVAEAHGAAAKLTGAGGGGCALIFIPGACQQQALLDSLAPACASLQPVQLGEPGVRLEDPQETSAEDEELWSKDD